MDKYFQQNIFGGEDEVLPTVPVIVLKNKEKEGRYLPADIEVADWEDPDGDVDIEGIECAFMIVRQDLKTPSQIDLDEKIAESETFKQMLREKYGEKAFVSFDMKRWLESYDPVNIEITPEQYKEACYINDWDYKLDEDKSITLAQFIEQKKAELEQSGNYKSVTLHSTYSVRLQKNSVGERFLSGETPKEQLGNEVNLADLPADFSSIPFKENGTKVTFELIAKGRRKPHTLNFYFLWEQVGEVDG